MSEQKTDGDWLRLQGLRWNLSAPNNERMCVIADTLESQQTRIAELESEVERLKARCEYYGGLWPVQEQKP